MKKSNYKRNVTVKKENYARRVTIRLRNSELERINQAIKKTLPGNISNYVRHLLLQEPITIKYRNTSLDEVMTEMIRLKNELNAIGNNFNQAVHKLHCLDRIPDIKIWLLVNEPVKEMFMKKTDEILVRMNQIYERWSLK